MTSALSFWEWKKKLERKYFYPPKHFIVNGILSWDIESLWNTLCSLSFKEMFTFQGKFSMQVYLRDSLTMRQWLTARTRMPPWRPQETCMLLGSRALISAVLAGFLTAAYVTPSMTPGSSVVEGWLEFTQFTCFPTRRALLTCTPNTMHIASRVNITSIVKYSP